MTTKRPPRNVGTVMLPAARLAQLHAIAARRDPPISAVELIEDFIGREIAAGAIRDEMPGFVVSVLDHGQGYVPSFVINADLDFGFEKMRSTDALAIAVALEAFSRPGSDKGRAIGTDLKRLSIARIGRGVVIAGSRPDQRRTVTPRMARDLARQLRAAAAQAEAMTAAFALAS